MPDLRDSREAHLSHQGQLMSWRSQFIALILAAFASCLANLLALFVGPAMVAIVGIVVIGLVGLAQFGIWMTPLMLPFLLPIFAATLLIRGFERPPARRRRVVKCLPRAMRPT